MIQGRHWRRRRLPPLGRRQIEILAEAAAEVTRACPWVTIDGDRRIVDSLVRRGLLEASTALFGIMPAGCLALRRHDRRLAAAAIQGLRKNVSLGEVMPWDV